MNDPGRLADLEEVLEPHGEVHRRAEARRRPARREDKARLVGGGWDAEQHFVEAALPYVGKVAQNDAGHELLAVLGDLTLLQWCAVHTLDVHLL